MPTIDRATLVAIRHQEGDPLALLDFPARLRGQTSTYSGAWMIDAEPVPCVVLDYTGQRAGSVRLVLPDDRPPIVRVDAPAPAAEQAMRAVLATIGEEV